jgi:hypothetical protein
MRTYQERCQAIHENCSRLKIVQRTIIDDKFARFKLDSHPDHLLGPIFVIVTDGFVFVFGDYDTGAFAWYSGNHWRGAINWIGQTKEATQYTIEKARAGMNMPMTQFDADQARRGVHTARRRREISRDTARECLDAIDGHQGSAEVTEGRIIQAIWDDDDADSEVFAGDPFHVPNNNVIQSHAVLRQLNQLLEAEEAAKLIPSCRLSNGEELKYYPSPGNADPTVIATGTQRLATRRADGEWILHCSAVDAQPVLTLIQSLPEEESHGH